MDETPNKRKGRKMTITPEKARKITIEAIEKQEKAKEDEIRQKAKYVCERVEVLIKEEAAKGKYIAEYEREYSSTEGKETSEKVGREAMHMFRGRGFEASFESNVTRNQTKLLVSWS